MYYYYRTGNNITQDFYDQFSNLLEKLAILVLAHCSSFNIHVDGPMNADVNKFADLLSSTICGGIKRCPLTPLDICSIYSYLAPSSHLMYFQSTRLCCRISHSLSPTITALSSPSSMHHQFCVASDWLRTGDNPMIRCWRLWSRPDCYWIKMHICNCCASGPTCQHIRGVRSGLHAACNAFYYSDLYASELFIKQNMC